MLFIISFSLCFILSLFIASSVNIKSNIGKIVTLYLIFSTQIVLVNEITGLLNRVGDKSIFLGIQFVFILVSLIFWVRAGKPSRLGIFLSLKIEVLGGWKEGNFISRILIIGVGIAYLVNAFLVVYVPPNSSDALMSHLARAAFWLQHNSFLPWITNYIPQIAYPFNAQVQYLWLMLFTGSDQLVGFVQFIAWGISFIAICGIARILGAKKSQALFAALIWSTFPQIMMQSSSTQSDLTVTAFVMCCLFLLFYGLQKKNYASLILSGLAFGMSIGTKQTVLFFLPGLFLGLLYWFFKYRTQIIKPLLIWGVSAVCFFTLIGSYNYIQNYISYNNLLGPGNFVQGYISKPNADTPLQAFTYNSARFLYQGIDPSGLPGEFPGYLQKFKSKISQWLGLASYLESKVGTDRDFIMREIPALHEDSTLFGLISIFLLVPCSIYEIYKGFKKRDPVRISIFLIIISFLIFFVLFIPGWDPYRGRYLIIPVTVAAPFMASFFQEGKQRQVWIWVISLLSLIILYTCLLFNQSKPLLGNFSIWGKDRVFLQTLNNKGDSNIYGEINSVIPKGSRVGYTNTPSATVFLLFGDGLNRSLFFIDSIDDIKTEKIMRNLDLDFVLVGTWQLPIKKRPDYLVPVVKTKEWILYQNLLQK